MKEFAKFLIMIVAGAIFGAIIMGAHKDEEKVQALKYQYNQMLSVVNACYTCAPECQPAPEPEE